MSRFRSLDVRMQLVISGTASPEFIDALAQNTSIDESPCRLFVTKSDDRKWRLFCIRKQQSDKEKDRSQRHLKSEHGHTHSL